MCLFEEFKTKEGSAVNFFREPNTHLTTKLYIKNINTILSH